MKYLTIVFAAAAFSALAFIPAAPGYQIDGTVTGLADNTWLYLRTATPDRDIDSCKVMNGKFHMRGSITEKAAPVYLHTVKYTNYVHFWLENTSIRIVLKAGEFKKGSITGSATQDEDKRLDAIRKPIEECADSLSKILEGTKDSIKRKSLLSQINTFRSQSNQVEKDWVKDHRHSLVAINLLNIYATTWGKETTQALYQNMDADMKYTKYGHEISDYLAVVKDLKVGDKFADFEQLNTSGKPVKLSHLKGKYILLDFWASWCGPCREENPNLVLTYAHFKNKGFAVMGVSLDENKTQWLDAVKKDQLTWENVSDLHGDKNNAALMYGIHFIPNNFLIDANGVIIAQNLRGKELDDKLDQLLH